MNRIIIRRLIPQSLPQSPQLVAGFSTAPIRLATHRHSGEPEEIEAEKQRNLRGEPICTGLSDVAPRWNEKLATLSEASVKADKDPKQLSQLQAATVECFQKEAKQKDKELKLFEEKYREMHNAEGVLSWFIPTRVFDFIWSVGLGEYRFRVSWFVLLVKCKDFNCNDTGNGLLQNQWDDWKFRIIQWIDRDQKDDEPIDRTNLVEGRPRNRKPTEYNHDLLEVEMSLNASLG